MAREHERGAMHFLVEMLIWVFADVIGAGLKRLFGFRRSSSGISEMWIGALFCVAVVAAAVLLLRKVV
jgi:CDP-diglyceride synthetase